MQQVLLSISACLYGATFLALSLAPARRKISASGLFKRLLALAISAHVGFTFARIWWLNRPPFFGKTELLSWFALSCALFCLLGARWLKSRLVIGWGVGGALAVTAFLALSYTPQVLPDLVVLHKPLVWLPGFASPIAYASGFLAFAAQLRSILAAMDARRGRVVDIDPVNEESMRSVSLALVRLCYPLLLLGFVAFALGMLEAVGRAWYWQRSVAAQLFTLVAYTVYLHISASEPIRRGRIFLAQSGAFCGVVISVLSFEVPRGILMGLGLGLFL